MADSSPLRLQTQALLTVKEAGISDTVEQLRRLRQELKTLSQQSSALNTTHNPQASTLALGSPLKLSARGPGPSSLEVENISAQRPRLPDPEDGSSPLQAGAKCVGTRAGPLGLESKGVAASLDCLRIRSDWLVGGSRGTESGAATAKAGAKGFGAWSLEHADVRPENIRVDSGAGLRGGYGVNTRGGIPAVTVKEQGQGFSTGTGANGWLKDVSTGVRGSRQSVAQCEDEIRQVAASTTEVNSADVNNRDGLVKALGLSAEEMKLLNKYSISVLGASNQQPVEVKSRSQKLFEDLLTAEVEEMKSTSPHSPSPAKLRHSAISPEHLSTLALGDQRPREDIVPSDEGSEIDDDPVAKLSWSQRLPPSRYSVEELPSVAGPLIQDMAVQTCDKGSENSKVDLGAVLRETLQELNLLRERGEKEQKGKAMERQQEQALFIEREESAQQEIAALRAKVQSLEKEKGDSLQYARMLERDLSRLKADKSRTDSTTETNTVRAEEAEAALSEYQKLSSEQSEMIRELKGQVKDLKNQLSAADSMAHSHGLEHESHVIDLSTKALQCRVELTSLAKLIRQRVGGQPISVANILSVPAAADMGGSGYRDGIKDLDHMLDEVNSLRDLVAEVLAQEVGNDCAVQ